MNGDYDCQWGTYTRADFGLETRQAAEHPQPGNRVVCANCNGAGHFPNGVRCDTCDGTSYLIGQLTGGEARSGVELYAAIMARKQDPYSASMDPDFPMEQMERVAGVELRHQAVAELRSLGTISPRTARQVGQALNYRWYGG